MQAQPLTSLENKIYKIYAMNRAMTKNKTHTSMIITSQQTVCSLHWSYHGELHMTAKIKIINI